MPERLERRRPLETAVQLARYTAIGIVAAALHGAVFALGNAEQIARAVRKELVSSEESKDLLEIGKKLVEGKDKIKNVFDFIAKAAMIEQGHSEAEVASARVKHNEVVQTGLAYKDSGAPITVPLDYVLSQQGEYEAGQRSVIDAYNKGKGNCDARLQKMTSELAEIFPEYYALGWIQGQTFDGVDGDGDGKYETPGVDTAPHARATMQVSATHRYILEGDHAWLEEIKQDANQPTTIEASALFASSYLANHDAYQHDSVLEGIESGRGPKPLFKYPGSKAVYRPEQEHRFNVTVLDEYEPKPDFTLDLDHYKRGDYRMDQVTVLTDEVQWQMTLQEENLKVWKFHSMELNTNMVDELLALEHERRSDKFLQLFTRFSHREFFYINDPQAARNITEKIQWTNGDKSYWPVPVHSPAAAREVAQHYQEVETPYLDIPVAYELGRGQVERFTYTANGTLEPAIVKTLLAGGSIKEFYYHFGAMTPELAQALSEFPLDTLSVNVSQGFTPDVARALAQGKFHRLNILMTSLSNVDPLAARELLSTHTVGRLSLSGGTPEVYKAFVEQLPTHDLPYLAASQSILTAADNIGKLNHSVESLFVTGLASGYDFAEEEEATILKNIEHLSIDTLYVGTIGGSTDAKPDVFIVLSKSRIKQIVFTGQYTDQQKQWIAQYLPNATFGEVPQ